MQVCIRFVIYGFITPKINTPKMYLRNSYYTKFKCAWSNFRNFKNAYTRKSSNLQVSFKRPYKKPQCIKLCALQLKCFRSAYKKAGTFFLPFVFKKANKILQGIFLFNTQSTCAGMRTCVAPSLSLVCVCERKCVRCNNSFNLSVYVSCKSCTKILFHVVV